MRRFSLDLPDDLGDALRTYSDDSGVPIAEIGRRAIARVVSEPSPYPMHGDRDSAPCLVRDMAAAMGGYDLDGIDPDEAADRLKRFAQWTEDMALRFDLTTANAAEVVPEPYRVMGDLHWTSDRPLVAAANRSEIANATPFTVPVVEGLTDSGAAGFDVIDAARAEGATATEGTLSPRARVVTPVARTGRFELTREIVDAAVPAGDAIALAAAAEDYRREVEALCYLRLNAAQAGVITAGFVPNGAQVRTSAGVALPADLKVALAEFATRRLGRARNVIAGGATAPPELVEALDDATGDDVAVARIQGARVNWATTAFGAAAGDMDVAILGSDDFWVWESPLLRFVFTEKAGPALVEVGVWGYVAAEVIRPRGLSSIRHT